MNDREPVLLYIPGETTEDERYRINSVLSHEKAHQHFGNIIACNWWSYVWLKEGIFHEITPDKY
jgi:aminopeptidase N